jgi:hypothetical protein
MGAIDICGICELTCLFNTVQMHAVKYLFMIYDSMKSQTEDYKLVVQPIVIRPLPLNVRDDHLHNQQGINALPPIHRLRRIASQSTRRG